MLLLLDHTGISPAIENKPPLYMYLCIYFLHDLLSFPFSFSFFFFFSFSFFFSFNKRHQYHLHLVLPQKLNLLKHQVIIEKKEALRTLLQQQFGTIAAKLHHAS